MNRHPFQSSYSTRTDIFHLRETSTLTESAEMRPLHSVLPELAAREVRCVHLGPSPDPASTALPPDEYAYLEYYCSDLNCDCRRVFLQVVAKKQPGKVFTSISYGCGRKHGECGVQGR